jgi:hypothetical protein
MGLGGLGWVVYCLPSLPEALDSIPSTEKKKNICIEPQTGKTSKENCPHHVIVKALLYRTRN